MKEFSKINELDKKDYYFASGGYIIFTKEYHLKRGYCCNNSCRHCPYKENKNKKKNKNE